MDAPTPHPIHPALYRPVLLAGTEPSLAILEGVLVAAVLILVGARLLTLVLVGFYLGLLHPLAVWAATCDPLFSGVYLRSLSYAGYYPAAGHLRGRRVPVRASVVAPR